MAALVAVETVVILLLVVLVTGLLRSHADILRALEELGVGLGDPGRDPGHDPGHADDQARPPAVRRGSGTSVGADVAGTSPAGDALSFAVGGDVDTLVAFLTSGCDTCRAFWHAFGKDDLDVPDGVRVVAVTAGPEDESASRVADVAAASRVPVVMSSTAWRDYEVPRSPYFVVVEAATGRIAGEGSASTWNQVVELVRRARADENVRRSPGARVRDAAARRQVEAAAHDRDREARNDAELLRAGIEPGDSRLHFPPDDDPDRG